MKHLGGRLLRFEDGPRREARLRIGKVHRDGSITFRGETYASLKEVPPDCVGVRLDLETYREWRRLWRKLEAR